jgi:hypothetical protein
VAQHTMTAPRGFSFAKLYAMSFSPSAAVSSIRSEAVLLTFIPELANFVQNV